MNNGLPFLLDSIFGKQNLESVSLEELYEVIDEFPSFNAAHYLLSRKLKLQNDQAYEMESMRTSLYFNNPIWLQYILEENYIAGDRMPESYRGENEPEKETHLPTTDFRGDTTLIKEPSDAEMFPESIGSVIDLPSSQMNEESPVKSFDELISKYKMEEVLFSSVSDENASIREVENIPETQIEKPSKLISDFTLGEDEKIQDFHANIIEEEYEIREEILNDYGIFEEVRVKKPEPDIASFDKSGEEISQLQENPLLEISANSNDSIIENEPVAELFKLEREADIEQKSSVNIDQETDEIIEHKMDADYEAFDKPVLENPGTSDESMPLPEFKLDADATLADATDRLYLETEEDDIDGNGQMQELVSRFDKQQKAMPAFDAKNAESIVFAPYHMIDYFASQGIKLVIEDQPSDSFTKQLKSFTDWLKVMKKIPVKQVTEKSDEKDAERIRRFAAHSIEERDILTESMAEVLAKQGMYENAIALYQKLSLIYPPKSAYFASRIEQLKASLS